MTRYTICEEGNPWLPGQLVLPGAITWEDRPIPVFGSNNDFEGQPIGMATDIQRDENSVLTAEVEWPKGSAMDLFGLLVGEGLTIWCVKVEWEHDDDGRRNETVKSAELKGLFVAQVPWGAKTYRE